MTKAPASCRTAAFSYCIATFASDVAFGRAKVGSIVLAIRMGLANELIVDRELENALSEVL